MGGQVNRAKVWDRVNSCYNWVAVKRGKTLPALASFGIVNFVVPVMLWQIGANSSLVDAYRNSPVTENHLPVSSHFSKPDLQGRECAL